MNRPILVIQYIHMLIADQNHFRMVAPSGEVEAYAPTAELAYERAMDLVEKKGYEVHDEVFHVSL